MHFIFFNLTRQSTRNCWLAILVLLINLSLKYHPYLKNVQNRTILILSFTWNMFCVISSWYKKVLAILILTFKCFGSCVAIVNKIHPLPFSWECNCIVLHLLLLLWFHELSRQRNKAPWQKFLSTRWRDICLHSALTRALTKTEKHGVMLPT